MTQTRDLTNVVAARLAAVREAKAGNFREAARLLEAPAAERPDDATLQLEYGNALVQAGANEKAIAAFDRVIALNPQIVAAHTNRSYALNKLGRHVEAESAGRRAIELAPGDPAAANNLAHALKLQGRFAESAAILEPVVARDPKRLEALNNLGDCRRALGHSDEAIAIFEKAISINPDFAHAHVNRALCRLQAGEWRRGFEEYEWRFGLGLPLQHRGAAEPWTGAPEPHRTLYIETEQGHGDAIQFVRLASAARSRVGRVVLMARRDQVALLGSTTGIDGTVTKSEKLPAEGLHVSLMSIPQRLQLDAKDFTMTRPYLAADPARVARWREWLAGLTGGNRRAIGLCWQGTPGIQPDLGRSMALDVLAPIGQLSDMVVVSLQKRDGLDQLSHLPSGMPVATPPAGFDDGPDAFVDTAALMMSLDRIISVDTAVSHLAGALARPVSLLLRKIPDWRWGLNGSETLWYPTMRLYRQDVDGDWTAPVARLAADLAKR
jgi:tetratricopeptide (TPR) repeat protein